MREASWESILSTLHHTGRVPAYRTLLAEAGVNIGDIQTPRDFLRLPILDKHNTFDRFPVHELCTDGDIGDVASVLTSSGHSGVFAFGLYDRHEAQEAEQQLDAVFDGLFQVMTRQTLMINCLPMGVRVPTQACTIGDTSVRADMALGQIKGFAAYYEQVVLVGETAFIKHLLELGISQGVDWAGMTVHVIVGEEPMAENARRYIQALLDIDPARPETGKVTSSMGVGELGLHLFYEDPPNGLLSAFRRALLDNRSLRTEFIGPTSAIAPCVFTFNPERIHVECLPGQKLVVTTLAPSRRIPLVRYACGDAAELVTLSERHRPILESAGLDFDALARIPIVFIHGRGQSADLRTKQRAFPEEIKEGLYADHNLTALTTANFRIAAEGDVDVVRIQLAPGVSPDAGLARAFAEAIAPYTHARIDVRCERYENFGSGMLLDYERKFDYMGR